MCRPHITANIHIILLAVASMAFWITNTACQRELSNNDPPLRPLIYTELPPETENIQENQTEEWINPSPEDLGLALFLAIAEHQRQNYEKLFITPEQLTQLVKTPPEDAQKQVTNIIEKSDILWKLFSTELPSEEPVGGLTSKLRLAEVRIGKGRNLSGKIAGATNCEYNYKIPTNTSLSEYQKS